MEEEELPPGVEGELRGVMEWEEVERIRSGAAKEAVVEARLD